ncbi:ankyrin repeat domain-containing protein [Niabella soli]|uniref:Uncharacterized protein n=1 Tax=Niabella soli DSM 19437 TaxID=929713 RepID=W0F848_9BACT|nr:ankyrin repeat domain-containing protein [Niabella soli]AHF17993.1 hypothetical protein NIASO_18370 [Niabella soli DSM 19437]
MSGVKQDNNKGPVREQDKMKKDNPPEKFFKGEDLKMATAIYKNDNQTIENLVKQEHFNVNGRGSVIIPSYSPTDTVRYTYLNYAVVIGALPAAEKLLQLGADVNLVAVNGGGYNANINMACSNRNKEMIRLLIQSKENLNPEFCDSPINDLLIGNADKSLIDLLLNSGANINYQSYVGGGVAVSTALNLDKFDFVNYFLDKGADPSINEYSGTSLALEIQSELAEGRLAANGLKEYTQLKERLINQFHIKFPVKREYRKGQEACIKRYENLSQADKDFLGKDEAERINLYKENLSKNITITGQSIDSFEAAGVQ